MKLLLNIVFFLVIGLVSVRSELNSIGLESNSYVNGSCGIWEWTYFDFVVGDSPITLKIIERNIFSDCDCYVKMNEFPTHHSYDWRDISIKMEFNHTFTEKGKYYAGLFSAIKCDYSIVAIDQTTHKCPNDCSGHGRCVNGLCECSIHYAGVDCSNEVRLLRISEIVNRSIKKGEWHYYLINLESDDGISIYMKDFNYSIGSDLDFYVKYKSVPDMYQFDYSNTSLATESMISISKLKDQSFYIGIYAYQCPDCDGCSYSLSSKLITGCKNRCSLRGVCISDRCSCQDEYSGDYCEVMEKSIELQETHLGYVNFHSWNYYSHHINSVNSISINLKLFRGSHSCSVYLRKDALPTIFHYDYFYNASSDVTLSVPQILNKTVWIGIYGSSICYYSILINISDVNVCRNGNLDADGNCICKDDWAGKSCEHKLNKLDIDKMVTGIIPFSELRAIYYKLSFNYKPSVVTFYLSEIKSSGKIQMFVDQEQLPNADSNLKGDKNITTDHLIVLTEKDFQGRINETINIILMLISSPYAISPPSYNLIAWASSF